MVDDADPHHRQVRFPRPPPSLFPLAEAAREAGEEVAVASGPDRRAHVEAAGFCFFPAGLSDADARARFAEVFPDWGHGGDFDHVYAEVFTQVHAPPMATHLENVVADFRPDVIVCDVGDFGAPAAAAAAGVPCVSHAFGLPIPASVAFAAGRAAAPLWRERGLEAPVDGGMYETLHIAIAPPSLDPGDGPPAARLWNQSPARPPLDPPAWLADLPERPTACLTFGTARGRNATVLRQSAAALAALDINVVATVGTDGDVTPISGVTVVAYVSQDAVLPRCDVVVCHAGSGTMLGALVHGVPLVALPQAADQHRNASAIARAGCGAVIEQQDLTPENVRLVVARVLADNDIRSAADAVRWEIATMPAPLDTAAALRALVDEGRQRLR